MPEPTQPLTPEQQAAQLAGFYATFPDMALPDAQRVAQQQYDALVGLVLSPPPVVIPDTHPFLRPWTKRNISNTVNG